MVHNILPAAKPPVQPFADGLSALYNVVFEFFAAGFEFTLVAEHKILQIYRKACEHKVNCALHEERAEQRTHHFEIGPRGVQVDERRTSECRWEDVREVLPECREGRRGPAESGKENAHRAHEQEEDEGGFTPCHKGAPCHAEQHADTHEDTQQQKYVPVTAPLGEAEHRRDDAGDVDAYNHEQQPVHRTASEHDSHHSPSRKALRERGKAAVLLAHGSHAHAHAVEHDLLYYQHEDCGNKEDAVGEGRVVGVDVLVGDGIYRLVGLRIGQSVKGISVYLNLVHLVQHHEVAAHQQVLVVEEAAHVGVDAEGGGLVVGEAVAEVRREVNYTVDFALLEEFAGLRHVGTMICDADFARGVHLPYHAPGVAAGGIVHHRDGGFLQDSVLVNYVVEYRVEESGDNENDHHSPVVEDLPEFLVEDVHHIRKPISYVSLVHKLVPFVVEIFIGMMQTPVHQEGQEEEDQQPYCQRVPLSESGSEDAHLHIHLVVVAQRIHHRKAP